MIYWLVFFHMAKFSFAAVRKAAKFEFVDP